MDNQPWQIRAKEAGLTQKALASIAGKPANTISRQMRGEFGDVPGYLIALIIAWEMMTDDQRVDWMRQLEREEGTR
ncbi:MULTISPECIES: hypothetical protein [unclassified Sphingomonas]|uniref:hypothetical protein n=1 Tax=unclassified Sphingomonas TaxID=196159 RepID=UPI0007019F57|nr:MULTISPECIES: hypothetical protein [unclassified Sphingomonas]KQM58808.1 hypothetical protein ASE65_10615 [Sphingomonas sp. Leaf16]KQN11064.1 hypothetical protein ASE81_11605 [Sphingomonas sp. Leaf29]KQN18364.1 hypothetical protein ASE83_11535 [Sphingomonas sp. Leaf32]